jgi:hypothetical protein
MGPPDDHVKYLLKAILPTGVDMLAIIDGEHDENGGEFDA